MSEGDNAMDFGPFNLPTTTWLAPRKGETQLPQMGIIDLHPLVVWAYAKLMSVDKQVLGR